jgi:amino acid adenylation domain-containing protein
VDEREHELIRRLRGGGPAAPAPRRAGGARRLASNAQQRLAFLARTQPGAATYSVPLAYRVRGSLSSERLDAALSALVARHEALRTGLSLDDGGVLWQNVAAPLPLRSEAYAADGFESALRRARGEAAVAFDIARPPLLRALRIAFAPDETLLVFLFHHAVCDAWSLGVFCRELARLYANGADAAALAEPALQYADCVDAQRAWLSGPAAERQRAFWRERLGGELPLLQLDYAQPPAETISPEGGLERLDLSAQTAAAVTALAERSGTTAFVVALAAFVAALHRYSLQDEIVVGIPAACRALAGSEDTIGYFSNTLALRAHVAPELRGAELIARTAASLAEALAYQELPFDEVVDLLGAPREAGRNPVFQAMFVMQSTPADEPFVLAGLDADEVIVHSGTAKLDLTCSLRASARGLAGELEYSAGVLDAASAARFADAYANLLADLARRPSARLGELALISPREAAERVAATVARCERYPDDEPLHVHVERQVRRTPGALAIEAGGETISYAALNARANALARRLRDEGAGPERTIGVCVDRSIELVVALLAILKAGAAFVPLDASFPAERIARIAQDARPLLLVTQARHRPLLAELSTPLLFVDDAAQPTESAVDPDGATLADPGVAVSAANAAYVYYTSGSTGLPKGVVIEHRCAMNRLEWLRRRYPLAPGERVLHKTPLIFDVAIWEIFVPLMAGATILMADPGAESDAAHIAKLLGREHTVLAHFVPSMLDAYLSVAPPAAYPGLRWVNLSGEGVSKRLLERFDRHFTAEFHNCYGQTETSEVAAWEGRAAQAGASVPMGRQIGIFRLHVLDDAVGPVPPGVPGELCVAGIGGLARGYHAQPGLTAERFVPNPFALAPGERLYRTGDLVRLSETGQLTYLGRRDQQTKIRGCRVETGDVEAALGRHPSVGACAVVARADGGGPAQLVAYVVSERPDADALGAHAEHTLPTYMRPAAYVFVDRLPRTPSGKLDRARLPAPAAADFEARAHEEAAETALERELLALWKNVLGLDKLGRADNFFTVGGNSLKSIQVLARIKESFGVELSVREFFAAPTVAGLAARIEAALVEWVASLPAAEVEQRLSEIAAR